MATAVEEMEAIKKSLIENALKGRWDEIVKIYKSKPAAYETKITKAGDTALHFAVSDGQVKIVEELIAQMKTSPDLPDLRIANEQGNTPLHVAAAMGNVAMCKVIAHLHPPLVGYQNVEGETPFFLAAFYGRKDAFLCLHRFCRSESLNGTAYARRKNGDTILHSAISGEYFDLAFYIIQLYRGLVNSINEEGFSPLHILAGKPTAFKSGSRLRRHEQIIYSYLGSAVKLVLKHIALFRLILIMDSYWQTSGGIATTKKIQEKKRKHTWALQVMNELLEDISAHEYAGNVGLVPKKGTSDDPEETVPYGIEASGSVVKKAFMGDDLSPHQTADSGALHYSLMNYCITHDFALVGHKDYSNYSPVSYPGHSESRQKRYNAIG
ncbi:Ankyrin-2 [Morella rubra]|uniref:Ankyrin-2 n=1 Tax=Morella rubra TaxID=262757 RepID=A0A6A1VTL0_9ROSI|nr:Ankyrin-2 [Morella rubra]